MVKHPSKLLITLLIVFILFSVVQSTDVQVSPFNGLSLHLDEKIGRYSFLLGGHLYGAYTNSVFPASSLLANIDKINSTGARFFVSLGDNFRDCNNLQISNYKDTFTSKLIIPLFNAVGNTDLTNRELYEKNFGEDTYFSFIYNDDLFLFLDGELNNGSILGAQLAFFLETVQLVILQPTIKNVFIFSHRWIWIVKQEYSPAFYVTKFPFKNNNFITDIEPALIRLANHKSVYWFSGENGPGTLPLFYEKDVQHNITYIAVGIGETEKDVLLHCNIDSMKNVTFTPFSLSGNETSSLETFGVKYWISYFKSDDNFINKYWLKAVRLLKHIYFWIGVLVSLSLTGFVLLSILIRKRLN